MAPTSNAQAHGRRDRGGRMAGKQRGRGQQQVGRQHHQLAVRQVEHPAHAIDQHVAAGDQRVDRGQHDDVDGELQVDPDQSVQPIRIPEDCAQRNFRDPASGNAKPPWVPAASRSDDVGRDDTHFTSNAVQSFTCTIAPLAASHL